MSVAWPRTDELGQQPRGAELWHQPDLDESNRELRVLGRVAHIAGQREGQSDTYGVTVNRCDHRLRLADQPGPVCADSHPAVAVLGLRIVGQALIEALQVGSCAEGSTFAGDHDRADPIVVVPGLNLIGHFRGHLVGPGRSASRADSAGSHRPARSSQSESVRRPSSAAIRL